MNTKKPIFIETDGQGSLLSVQVNRPTCSTGEPQAKNIMLYSFQDEEADPTAHWLTIETAEQLILELQRAVREVEHERLMGQCL
jgi:hypothetical protein